MAAEQVNEQPTVWQRIAQAARVRNIFQPWFIQREKKPIIHAEFVNRHFPITDNAPAIKQLHDLQQDSKLIPHIELATLSKPTLKTTKDRIFVFVEGANRPVTVKEIAASMPDVARSGVSSRVSEMLFAGSLYRQFLKRAAGDYQMHYTVEKFSEGVTG